MRCFAPIGWPVAASATSFPATSACPRIHSIRSPGDGADLQEGPKPRDEGRVGALFVPVLPEAAFSVLVVGENDAVCREIKQCYY